MIKQLAKQVIFGLLNAVKSTWNTYQLKGHQVYCPCCDSHFGEFLPYGGKEQRPNVCCPRCGSVERHRLLWLFLERETGLLQEKHKLLHIGPQHIYIRRFQQIPHIDYIFGDLSPDYFMRSRGGKILDVTALNYADNTFDAVLCNHVLEHVPDDRKAMRELLRVLKPDGWAVLQVPLDLQRKETYEDFSITDPIGREKAFGQKDHVRWYGQDYTQRLREAGFQVDAIAFGKNLPSDLINTMRLDPSEEIFFCRKPQPQDA